MTARPLVEIERLCVTLGGVSILRDVTLSVAPGSWHALVGPNGAGKSTLLRALTGQIPFGGRIACHWRDSGRIGYVPQSLAVDRGLPLTVADFLTLAWRGGRARVDEQLERVGLAGLARRRLDVLSGGELRRVLLAQALLPAPELLLLDEPGGGVDREALRRIESVLAGLRDEGVTLLVVTHDLAQVRRLADRVSGLDGSLCFDGPPAEVLTLEAALAAFRPGMDSA